MIDVNIIADLAQEITQSKRLGGGKVAKTGTATAVGDTTIYTPAAGKAITLYWISAVNDPTASSAPVIKIKIGTTEIYRTFAVSHWEPFTGAPNEALIVNLSASGNVQITAHITEA